MFTAYGHGLDDGSGGGSEYPILPCWRLAAVIFRSGDGGSG